MDVSLVNAKAAEKMSIEGLDSCQSVIKLGERSSYQ